MSNNLEVPITHGLDVPNCFKDVSNFMKDVPNFVKDVPNCLYDVPWVLVSIPGWRTTSNSFLRVPKRIYKP